MANELFHVFVYDTVEIDGEDVVIPMSNEPYEIKTAGTSTVIASGNADANGLIAVDLGTGRKVVDVYINGVLKLEDVGHMGVEYG